jgi:hypothetical protein
MQTQGLNRMSHRPNASSDRRSSSGVAGKTIKSVWRAFASTSAIPGHILDAISALT